MTMNGMISQQGCDGRHSGRLARRRCYRHGLSCFNPNAAPMVRSPIKLHFSLLPPRLARRDRDVATTTPGINPMSNTDAVFDQSEERIMLSGTGTSTFESVRVAAFQGASR